MFIPYDRCILKHFIFKMFFSLLLVGAPKTRTATDDLPQTGMPSSNSKSVLYLGLYVDLGVALYTFQMNDLFC